MKTKQKKRKKEWDNIEVYWGTLFPHLTRKQKDAIGDAYLRHIIGCNPRWEKFEVDHTIHAVVMGLEPIKGDYRSFYKELEKRKIVDLDKETLEMFVRNGFHGNGEGFIYELSKVANDIIRSPQSYSTTLTRITKNFWSCP